MEIFVLIFTLLLGAVAGFFGFKAAGRNDNSGNSKRIESELDAQRESIESERDGIKRERERLESERNRNGEERKILDRDKQLISELKRRAEESTGG